ncbi:MAG: LysM peptidoglycan-binding domain-containing protein, partial [Mesorhizobium sp.]
PAGQVLAMIEEPGKASELLTVPTPETKPESPPAGDKAAAPAAEDSAAGDPSAATPDPAAPAATAPGTVEAAPAPDGPAAPASPVAGPKVVVEAIEIDGNKIFVAGLADPGRKVRAYANDILLGDAKTSPDGHFLVEATRNIPVGTYTIHVDALDADGVKVVARAAV